MIKAYAELEGLASYVHRTRGLTQVDVIGRYSTLRAVQLWEHVFWGCVGAQEVRGVLQRQLPQGVALLPKHVWLLEPPAPTIDPIIWVAVGIAALTVMLTVSKGFGAV